ncbi:MAG: hypothetical protein M3Q23_17670 [Actinomycetota bacterium]|nr:hypothetical protein [Actinomycetota bacterium]
MSLRTRHRIGLMTAMLVLATVVGTTAGVTVAGFIGTTSNGSNSITAATDFVAPNVTASVVERTAGGGAGYLTKGSTYYVYANVTDTGNPASGVSSVTAHVKNIENGANNVALTSGSYTAGGVTYSYRSASRTADSNLSDGVQSYTVGATDNANNSGTASSFSVTIDSTAPSVSASVIARSGICSPGTAGFIRANGAYFLYANVSDGSGSGVQTVTANVSNVTTGQTAVSLTSSGGPFSVGGVSYTYRSSSLTANSSLSTGSQTYTITATDNLGTSSGAQSGSVTVDNQAPSASDIQTTNVSGGTAGHAEAGDKIIFTFSENMEPCSISSSWDGTGSVTVTVRMNKGTGSSDDTVQVYDSGNSSQLPFGTVDLGVQQGYATANRTFPSSTMTMSGAVITITLGTASGSTGTISSGTTTMTWNPSSSAIDRAGGTMSTTARAETGTGDLDF